MQILMTGATGLVGKALGIELVRRGHNLTIVSRSKKDAQLNCPFPCKVIEANLTETPITSESLADIDAVINLMGESIAKGQWTDKKKKQLIQSRVNATKNLRESFNDFKPKIFISASAVGVYGDRKDEVLDESSPLGDDFLARLCKAWEAEAFTFESPATRVAIGRFGVVISDRGGFMPELAPLFQAGLGGVIAGGHQWMSWIHIDDLVDALIFALDSSSAKGVFNAVTPSPVSNQEFTQTMAKLLHRPSFASVPEFALKLALQEKSVILTSSQRVHPTSLESWGYQFKFPNLEAAITRELQNQIQGNDHFVTQQFIPKKPEEIFPFFAEAKNLSKIIPDTLDLKILKVSSPEMKAGTRIDYSLKIHGVLIHWRTEIEVWDPPREFVDIQLKGPFSLWHHTHTFEPLSHGTLMTERVKYKVPMGFIGWLAGHHLVQNNIESIFSFRSKAIAQRFKGINLTS